MAETKNIKWGRGGYPSVPSNLKPKTTQELILDFLRRDHEVHTLKEIFEGAGASSNYNFHIKCTQRLVAEEKVLYVARGKFQAKKRRVVRVKKSTIKKIRESKSSSGK